MKHFLLVIFAILITDFYYLDVSGESVGVSGIDFGKAGKLGFSVTRSDRSGINTSRNYIVDLRLAGTDLGFGSLDLGVDYALSAQTEQEELANDSHDGAMITGQFTNPSRKAPSYSYGDIRHSQKI